MTALKMIFASMPDNRSKAGTGGAEWNRTQAIAASINPVSRTG
jgi:hypothetical protein